MSLFVALLIVIGGDLLVIAAVWAFAKVRWE